MGVGSVVLTFVMCILFNVLLPTGDIGSDMYLMRNTLMFNLGRSVELSGCKACYYKSEDDVYDLSKKFRREKRKWCLIDKSFYCGQFLSVIDKMVEWETSSQEMCLANQTFRVTKNRAFESGKCDERNDFCCLTTNVDQENKDENALEMLNPKAIFTCHRFANTNFDFCIVAGVLSSLSHCYSLTKLDKSFNQKIIHIFNTVIYPYQDSQYSFSFSSTNLKNETVEIKQANWSTPLLSCVIVFKRRSSLSSIVKTNSKFQCYENSCRSHLKALHYDTKIHDLQEWRKSSSYYLGIKVGGKSCGLLAIYGIMIGVPILLNLAFNIVLFTEDIQMKNASFCEIFPLIFLCYPQFKTIKFLYKYLFVHGDENQLNADKEENERDVATLEPFLESCLQVIHIIIT